MESTFTKMDRARGFLLLDDCNVFIYCCARCTNEFISILELEVHILNDCVLVKRELESVFVDENDVLDSILNNGVYNEAVNCLEENDVTEAILQEFEPENDEMFDVHSELGPESESESVLPPDRTKERLVRMNTIQLDRNKYYCEMCPFNDVYFTLKKGLLEHMRQRHMTKIRLRTCRICNEPTRTLVHHMKTQHDGKRPYPCPMCKRSCISEFQLANHIRTHTGERPFLCSTCGSAFKTSNALTEHIKRLHTKGKLLPFSCQECDESFRLTTQFERHRLLMHSDQRPHVCNICGKKFSKTNYLYNHKFIHDEKCFPCKYCGKMFKTTSCKRQHERKSHEEK